MATTRHRSNGSGSRRRSGSGRSRRRSRGDTVWGFRVPALATDVVHGHAPGHVEHLIGRSQQVTAVRRSFAQHQSVAVVAPGGGTGKSTLALLVAQEVQTEGEFPDGVFWVGLRKHLSGALLRAAQAALVAKLTGSTPYFVDATRARIALTSALAQRRCLVILDDVWSEEQVLAFSSALAGNNKTKLLMTSRMTPLMKQSAQRVVHVDTLDAGEACELFLSATGGTTHASVQEELLRLVAGNPLAINMLGGLLRDKDDGTWRDVAAVMRKAQPLPHSAGTTPHASHPDAHVLDLSVHRVLAAMLQPGGRLTDAELAHLRHLAVLPYNTVVSLDVLARLWGLQDAKAARSVLAVHLVRQYHVLYWVPGTRGNGVTVHDSVLDYLRAVHQADLPALHAHVVDAYVPLRRMSDDLGSVPADGYYHAQIARHVFEAQRSSDLAAACASLPFLRAVLLHAGPEAARDACALVQGDVPALRVVRAVLRQARQVLTANPDTLPWILSVYLPLPGAETGAGHADQVLANLAAAAHQAVIAEAAGQVDLQPVLRLPVDTSLDMDLRGHHGDVQTLTMLPGRSRLVSTATDGAARVWDARTGRCVRVLAGHVGAVTAVALLPGTSPHRLVTGGADGRVCVWDLDSGRVSARIDSAHGGLAVTCVTTMSDGAMLVTGGRDQGISIWNTSDGSAVRTFKAPATQFAPEALAIVSVDGHNVIMAHYFDFLRTCDTETYDLTLLKKDFSTRVYDMLPLDDGDRVAFAAFNDVVIWSLSETATALTCTGHKAEVQSLARHSSDQLLSGAADGSVRLWNLSDGTCVHAYAGAGHGAGSRAVAGLDAARFLVASGHSVHAVAVQQAVQPLHREHVIDVVPITDDLAVSACAPQDVRVWQHDTGKQVEALKAMRVSHVTGIPGNSDFLVARSLAGIQRYHLGRLADEVVLPHKNVYCMRAMSDCTVVSSTSDHGLAVWDFATGTKLVDLPGHKGVVRCLDVLDADTVLSGGQDRTVRLWGVRTAVELKKIDFDAAVTDVAFLDKAHAVVASGGTLYVVNLTTGLVDKSVPDHKIDRVFPLADKKHVLTASGGVVRVWDWEAAECRRVFRFASPVSAFGCRGQRLLIGFRDGHVASFQVVNVPEAEKSVVWEAWNSIGYVPLYLRAFMCCACIRSKSDTTASS